MPNAVAKMYRGLPTLALAMAVLLLIAGIGLAVRNESAYTDQKVRELEVQARIMASSVLAALVFDDAGTAGEYVAALSANPELRAAAVYRADGERFASFARTPALELPEIAPDIAEPVTANTITVRAVVAQDDLPVGTVYLTAARETPGQRIARYGGVALLVVMGSLVAAVLAVAQRALARGNRTLRDTAAELREANRHLQLQIEGREKAEAALRQAQKMETIGQLTGGIAHDFNNLLTIILGNLERLLTRLKRGDPPERIREGAQNAIKGAERAAALTQRLLAFSRRQPLDPKPVDVNKLVGNMSDLLHRTLGEQVTIETVIAGGLWRTLVDPNQLENAILNLAVNARDAMPGGGKLTIETANAFLDSRYAAEQSEVDPGQYVAICISDTGVGMTKEVIQHAFEPFFTTKDVGHGTGLGLSQVYGFVKQSGGHVKIYSEPGEGTTIKIYLPRLKHDHMQPEEQKPRLARDHRATGHAILVVEDEPLVRANSVECLTGLGYNAYEANDGPSALDMLARHPEIVLLFTDVGLPGGMNGRLLAEEARRRNPRLRVLFTTGYARNAIVHDGRLDPGVKLVTKPFSEADLAAAIADVLNEKRERPRILLVEDEFLIRSYAVDLLHELGCDVVDVATADEAVGELSRAGGAFDGALIDIGLPGRAGDSLIKEARERYPGMPILVVTGNPDHPFEGGLAADPMIRVLGKPYPAEQLARLLRELGVGV